MKDRKTTESTSGNLIRTIWWMSFYAIAMGFLEAAVVVYLREIYYPGGFTFPLAPMDQSIRMTEVLREAATLIMLLAAGYLAGNYIHDRFAWFLYAFAVWDIFYYMFLWLLVGWPDSLLEWDILFLIPVVWTGPVLAPVLVSLSMILLACVITEAVSRKKNRVDMRRADWLILSAGAIVVFVSFVWDYCSFLAGHPAFDSIRDLADSRLMMQLTFAYVPVRFNWGILAAGEAIILADIIRIFIRNRPEPESAD